jgi:hypothetical protein
MAMGKSKRASSLTSRSYMRSMELAAYIAAWKRSGARP